MAGPIFALFLLVMLIWGLRSSTRGDKKVLSKFAEDLRSGASSAGLSNDYEFISPWGGGVPATGIIADKEKAAVYVVGISGDKPTARRIVTKTIEPPMVRGLKISDGCLWITLEDFDTPSLLLPLRGAAGWSGQNRIRDDANGRAVYERLSVLWNLRTV